MNKRGIALIVAFMVIVVLTILGSATISRSVSERFIAQRYAESMQAFWLAEAGVNRALKELKSNSNTTGSNLWRTELGQGGYYVDIESLGSNRKVTAYGFLPFSGVSRIERIIEVIISKSIPPNFYDNAIYSAGEVKFIGNAYSVSGDVRYADEIEYSSNRVTGTITQDPSISPLALLSFQQLYDISQRQGYVYDEARLQDVQRGRDSFPASFWSGQGTDGLDNDNDGQTDEADEKVNVVYVTTNLQLNGSIGTIGGFFAVVGDVITDTNSTSDATLDGNGTVNGVIYTRGEFKINGGGQSGLNVNGGVWSGEEVELKGSSSLTYNQPYMFAVRDLNINVEAQIVSWRDTQNPYTLAP